MVWQCLVLALLGVWGVCWGSFLNVLIYRLPKRLPVIWGRSFCPKCRKKISWFDNIPLLSFVFLRGRCRSCRKKISLRYPAVELLTGALFLLGYLGNLGNLGGIIFSWVLVSAGIVIFFIDLEHQIIPDSILIVGGLYAFVHHLITNYQLLITNFLPTAIISFIFFLLIFLITKGKGLGFGDVKFAFLIGLSLGFPGAVIAFYLAFLTGAIIGTILIIIRKAKFGQKIAFGPFLVVGWLGAYFFREKFVWMFEKLF